MDKDFVKNLAEAVKITYSDEDVNYWAKALGLVKTWADEIAAIDTSVPEEQTAQPLYLRTATPQPSEEAGALAAAFPAREDNMAKVKKVI